MRSAYLCRKVLVWLGLIEEHSLPSFFFLPGPLLEVPKGECSEADGSVPKADGSEASGSGIQKDDEVEVPAKRARGERPASPLVFFVPDSPVYDSGAETELSIQGQETACATDTSDDLWFLEESSGEGESDSPSQREGQMVAAVAAHLLGGGQDGPFEVEYELRSPSPKADGDRFSSDSDVEDIVLADVVVCVPDDDDAQFWADSSDSQSSDSEIGEDDLWQCCVCGNRNVPFQRYCQRCWKRRFGWLPDRENRHPPKKRCRKPRSGTPQRSSKSARLSHPVALDSEGHSQPDSHSQESNYSAEACASVSTCPHPEEPVATASAAEASSQEGDDVVQPGCSRWPENVAPSPKDMCAMCVSRPRDGILIHGQTSHSYGCYKCSRKLLTCNQRCPICRRHIDRVTRHYVD